MINRYILSGIVCCLLHFTLIAQTGDDGLNSNVIHSFANASETARVSVSLIPGFSTSGNTFHAFISPDIQYHNSQVETDGDFGQNFIRVYRKPSANYIFFQLNPGVTFAQAEVCAVDLRDNLE